MRLILFILLYTVCTKKHMKMITLFIFHSSVPVFLDIDNILLANCNSDMSLCNTELKKGCQMNSWNSMKTFPFCCRLHGACR